MAFEFDKMPSEIELIDQEELDRQACNVEGEITDRREMLLQRTTQCKIMKPMNRGAGKVQKDMFAFKFICVCPQYNPCYPCKHTGNIIIDRDVLTRDEHTCILATPKVNPGFPRKPPRFYHKRITLPFTSARISQLAEPKKLIMQNNIELYSEILGEQRVEKLAERLYKNIDDVNPISIETALSYITEEVRLTRVAENVEKAKCRKLKKLIKNKQKRQIKKIVCVLFEEMKDFLLNDQFLIDECSMLTKVILEKIREFTDNDFYSTSNLREYQKILANNMAVWINKFIAALSIYVTQPQKDETQPTAADKVAEMPEPATFVPVYDFMSLSTATTGEEDQPDTKDFIDAVESSDHQDAQSKDLQSIVPMDYDKDFTN